MAKERLPPKKQEGARPGQCLLLQGIDLLLQFFDTALPVFTTDHQIAYGPTQPLDLLLLLSCSTFPAFSRVAHLSQLSGWICSFPHAFFPFSGPPGGPRSGVNAILENRHRLGSLDRGFFSYNLWQDIILRGCQV